VSRARQRQIFDHFKDRVYSLALRYTNDPDDASDLAQEIFLKIFQGFPSFRAQAKLDTWIYRIAMNTCIDRQRRKKRLLQLDENALITDFDPCAAGEEAEMMTMVQRAVTELPDGTRESIVLRYVNGCSYKEIAEILGSPPGTIAARISRGHQMLRKKLAHLREWVR